MESKTSSQPPAPTTSSTSAVETVEGTHVFHISGYSLLRCQVRSSAFAVGGYNWSIRFRPDGGEDCSFHPELMTPGSDVRAYFTVGFVNQADGSTRWKKTTPPIAFSTTGRGPASARFVVRRSELEDFTFLRGDCLSIVCVAAVVKDPHVSASEAVSRVEVPPPDLPECLRKLLEEGEGTDVTFNVGEDTLAAHRIVLAMRSPVFKAELYGPMREERTRCVTVEDMQPAVFRALLHFIYTDSLPAIDHLDGNQIREMICHLLVAADRYAMERLKMMCQGILCKTLRVDTVAATLALADQHHCSMLKDACMEFIFSSNRLGDVVASQGYLNLKRTCPSLLVEVLERSSKFRKI